MKPLLVYDIEIIKAIPPRGGELEEGVEYCAGWDDHANMGVACIGAYDFETDRTRVFLADNIAEFEALAGERPVAGFNSIKFDDQVCRACGIEVRTGYDLLVELWAAAGLGPTFRPATHVGYGLDATAQANGLPGKTGHGALAPVQWQRGECGKVIDYCLEDVRLTVQLIREVDERGSLECPKTGRMLDVRPPGNAVAKQLTPKQARFVDEYLVDLDATNAARRAGYAPTHAKRVAWGLLRKPHVERAVAAAQAKRAKRLQLESDDVLRKLADLAYTDLRELVTWDAGGVRLIDSAKLSDAASAAVCKVRETKHGLEVEREPRTQALKLLGMHLGLFEKKVKVEAAVTDLTRDIESMTDGELEAELERMRGQAEP